METLEALASRIDTTEEIQSIVRTMKSLSAVSIRQYERAVEALHDYQQTIDLGFQVVLHGNASRLRVGEPGDGPSTAIVIGSDRGLCGRFNEALTDFVAQELSKRQAFSKSNPLILSVGARTAARLEAIGLTPDEAFALPGSVNGLVQTAQAVLVQADRWRHEKGAAHIRVFFNRRIGDTLARPTSRTLTPLSQAYLDRLTDRSWPTRRLPTFSMDADALFSWLVRQHLFISLYRAGAESMASEHASRLAAMQAAERNINDRLDELTAQYRKKRQESITTELMDIVSGFEAMAGAEDTTSPDQ